MSTEANIINTTSPTQQRKLQSIGGRFLRVAGPWATKGVKYLACISIWAYRVEKDRRNRNLMEVEQKDRVYRKASSARSLKANKKTFTIGDAVAAARQIVSNKALLNRHKLAQERDRRCRGSVARQYSPTGHSPQKLSYVGIIHATLSRFNLLAYEINCRSLADLILIELLYSVPCTWLNPIRQCRLLRLTA